VNDIAWGGDGRHLGSACADDVVHVVNIDDFNKPRIRLRGHSDDVLRVAFSHKGSLVASFGRTGPSGFGRWRAKSNCCGTSTVRSMKSASARTTIT
jgi:WD40 repeat protein